MSSSADAGRPRVLIYLLRRDVRLSDNTAFHHASFIPEAKSSNGHSSAPDERRDSLVNGQSLPHATHLLPVYVFPANQVEVSGFLASPDAISPYPEARSEVAGIWRCGPHRAKFMAEGVWDLKEKLESLNCGSGLEIRAGIIQDVLEHMLEWFEGGAGGKKRADIAGVWMTSEEGTEEKRDEKAVARIAEQRGVPFKLWDDEKFYIDNRDLPIAHISELPNIYTTYRKSLEPLRSRPRHTVPTPTSLPPLPLEIPPPMQPFNIPSSLADLQRSLLSPLEKDPGFSLPNPPQWPPNAFSAHPFSGGESAAQERLSHLITSGSMTAYKQTRNGMLGLDFSTKLSAYLAQGHITARQVHWAMHDFEEGHGEGSEAEGYGKGENEGTAAVRFELVWRDYMALCMRKFGSKMFDINGIREPAKMEEAIEKGEDVDDASRNEQRRPPRKRWRYLDHSGGAGDDPAKTVETFGRFRSGTTGMSLIDASNRELFLTGYTSNRARQNVASFLSSHLGIDWRIGAEWYECMLVDHDVANNWGNWQYVAGVGNDPRQGRVFNPVKQALDYDAQGEYIRAWLPELRPLKLQKQISSKDQGAEAKGEVDPERLMGLFQPWRLSDWEKKSLGLTGGEAIEHPLVRINFSVQRGKGGDGRGRGRGRGGWKGKGRGGSRDFRRLGNEEKAAMV